MKSKNGAMSNSLINRYKKALTTDENIRVARNALTRTSIRDVAMNRDVITEMNYTFSHIVKTGKITNQKASGRCWLFAGLNTLRVYAMQKMNMKHFELSQSYSFFWDKFEKSNYFLENIIETRKEDVHSRIVMWLLSQPLNDGGQWDMFANLVDKYGVVPKDVMPESFNSSTSGYINYLVSLKLKENAKILRDMDKKGATVLVLRKLKEEMMAEIYKMLVMFFGEPPTEFTWQYRDKKDKFHRDSKKLTPIQFYKKYIGLNLDEMVSIINCPTRTKPLKKMYTLKHLGNMVGGRIIRYLNVDTQILKKYAMKILAGGEPVWFGCDVGKMLNRDNGIMHTEMYEYDKLLGVNFGMDKATRVEYCESLMTHAMVFLGVDLVNNKPTKWLVENSWGDKGGKKGMYVMNDKWFDEYLYQVVVPKKLLPVNLQKILKQKPIELPPWDPMGSLALMR